MRQAQRTDFEFGTPTRRAYGSLAGHFWFRDYTHTNTEGHAINDRSAPVQTEEADKSPCLGRVVCSRGQKQRSKVQVQVGTVRRLFPPNRPDLRDAPCDLCFPLLLSAATFSPTMSGVTPQDLAKHASADSCWITVHGTLSCSCKLRPSCTLFGLTSIGSLAPSDLVFQARFTMSRTSWSVQQQVLSLWGTVELNLLRVVAG